MAKLAFILVFVFSSLYFARYFVVRQWQQVQQLEAYEAGYKPYLQLAQWLKSEMAQKNPAEKNMEKHVGGFFENVPTFYYWSMGYSLYLHSDLPCPGRISPSILTLGDNGAQLVLDDLQNLQQKNNIVFLVENPETFPKNITQPDSFPAGSRARQTVETYLSWRDREFKKVDIDFGPFQVYRRVSP